MSVFSETLNNFMLQNNLRSADIYKELKMNKSTFSKIKNDTLLPKNYDIVIRLAEAMKLNSSCTNELCSSYKTAKFGTFYPNIENLIKSLINIEPIENKAFTDNPEKSEYVNGQLIQSYYDVGLAVLNVLSSAEDKLNITFQPRFHTIINMVSEGMSRMSENVKINWLVFFSGKSVDNISAANMDIVASLAPVMINPHSDFRYQYSSIDEFYNMKIFPFLIQTENHVLLLSEDCSTALYLCDKDIIQLYERHFTDIFDDSKRFSRFYNSVGDFLSSYDETMGKSSASDDEMYIIRRHPSIIISADRNIIENYTRKEMNPELTAAKSIEYLNNHTRNIKRQNVYFSAKGLEEFFDSDNYSEFSDSVTSSIPKDVRVKMLGDMLENYKRNRFLVHRIFKNSILENSNVYMINIWKSGKILITYKFGESCMFLAMNEKSISASMVEFFKCLSECGILLSAAESRAVMEDALRKYK